MSKIDSTYHQLCDAILQHGYEYTDESRDVKCKQLSSLTLDIPLDEMPLITTKKMFTKGFIAELIWFLRGDTNIKYLVDNGVNIWNKDAYNFYCELSDKTIGEDEFKISYEEFLEHVKTGNQQQAIAGLDYKFGDVGRNYGAQWRTFRGLIDSSYGPIMKTGIDQISNLIDGVTENPMKRRWLVNAWNPTELDRTALPPCHWAWEIIPKPLRTFEKIDISGKDSVYLNSLWDASVSGDTEAKGLLEKELEGVPNYGFTLKWHQRSVDTFLGLPFNIASYATTAMIIEGFTGMKALNLIADLSNIHIYKPHFEQVRKQLKNPTNTYNGCGLEFSDKLQGLFLKYRKGEITVSEVFDLMEVEDFSFPGYKSYPVIKADMIAPK